MGKGDRKTRRGKIIKGTFGVSRPKRTSKSKDSAKVESKSKAKTSASKASAKSTARKPAASRGGKTALKGAKTTAEEKKSEK